MPALPTALANHLGGRGCRSLPAAGRHFPRFLRQHLEDLPNRAAGVCILSCAPRLPRFVASGRPTARHAWQDTSLLETGIVAAAIALDDDMRRARASYVTEKVLLHCG